MADDEHFDWPGSLGFGVDARVQKKRMQIIDRPICLLDGSRFYKRPIAQSSICVKYAKSPQQLGRFYAARSIRLNTDRPTRDAIDRTAVRPYVQLKVLAYECGLMMDYGKFYLTPDFLAALAELPLLTAPNMTYRDLHAAMNSYDQFFSEFGTHFITKSVFGAKWMTSRTETSGSSTKSDHSLDTATKRYMSFPNPEILPDMDVDNLYCACHGGPCTNPFNDTSAKFSDFVNWREVVQCGLRATLRNRYSGSGNSNDSLPLSSPDREPPVPSDPEGESYDDLWRELKVELTGMDEMLASIGHALAADMKIALEHFVSGKLIPYYPSHYEEIWSSIGSGCRYLCSFYSSVLSRLPPHVYTLGHSVTSYCIMDYFYERSGNDIVPRNWGGDHANQFNALRSEVYAHPNSWAARMVLSPAQELNLLWYDDNFSKAIAGKFKIMRPVAERGYFSLGLAVFSARDVDFMETKMNEFLSKFRLVHQSVVMPAVASRPVFKTSRDHNNENAGIPNPFQVWSLAPVDGGSFLDMRHFTLHSSLGKDNPAYLDPPVSGKFAVLPLHACIPISLHVDPVHISCCKEFVSDKRNNRSDQTF